MRQPGGGVIDQIRRVGEDAVCTSIVAAAELRSGARKKTSAKLSVQLEAVLSRLEILPLDVPADLRYAELRLALVQAGTPIGPNDMLIAAHALTQHLTLVSDNLHEFSRIPRLSVENWLGA